MKALDARNLIGVGDAKDSDHREQEPQTRKR